MDRQRAIVFDLDDTLYPYQAFVRSGFRAVAEQVSDERAIPKQRVTALLDRAAGDDQGREIQVLARALHLPAGTVSDLVGIIRNHEPSMRLPLNTARVLRSLRRSWKIGVLTNGTPEIQRRKIAALGLTGLVDAIVFAGECGDGRGKPAPEPFRAILDLLGVSAEATVFVGNDASTDVRGAAALGIRTIHLTEHVHGTTCLTRCADVHVARLQRVPRIARQLLTSRSPRHAA